LQSPAFCDDLFRPVPSDKPIISAVPGLLPRRGGFIWAGRRPGSCGRAHSGSLPSQAILPSDNFAQTKVAAPGHDNGTRKVKPLVAQSPPERHLRNAVPLTKRRCRQENLVGFRFIRNRAFPARHILMDRHHRVSLDTRALSFTHTNMRAAGKLCRSEFFEVLRSLRRLARLQAVENDVHVLA